MQQFNNNLRDQDSSHTFEVQQPQRQNQIYMSSTATQRKSKISQQIDFKNIGILIGLKVMVIFLYFIFSDFKLLDFMFVTILISMDFWLNKNIFGKHLAGLRWWIELDQYTEQQHWIFQSADPNIQINTLNNGVFWITNLTVAIFWFINLLIITIISNSLFWVALCMFCLGTTLINLLCFYKCRGNHQKKLRQIIEKVGLKSATHLLMRTDNMKDQGQNGNFQIQ